jgi:hypothetical protein
MINSFNTNIATKFSVNTAIFIQHLAQWTFINQANNRHIHDGFCWSYNTLDAFDSFFPYWTKKQTRTVIANAIEQGLVIKGNYNKNQYDRTAWYALSKEGISYYPELQSFESTTDEKFDCPQCETSSSLGNMHMPKWANGSVQKGTPIPTNKPTKRKNINKLISKRNFSLEDMLANNPFELEESLLKDWVVIREGKKAVITKTAWTKILSELQKCVDKGKDPKECFVIAVTAGWRSIKAEWFDAKHSQKLYSPKPATDDTSWGKDFYVNNQLGF